MSIYARSGRLGLILSDILTTMLKRQHPPQQNTLVMLDEAALLGTMSEIRLAFTTLRSYGIQLWTIWQDPGQIEALYSDWTTLIANTHTVMWMPDNTNLMLARARGNGANAHIASMLACNEQPEGEEVLVSYDAQPAKVMRLPPWFTDPRLRNVIPAHLLK